MLSIKFKRIGKKKQATYRVIVAERRSKLHGRFVEDLGWANPHTDEFKVNEDRAKHWLAVGAQPTDSVHNLLVRAGIVLGKKKAVHAVKPEPEQETPAAAPAEAPAATEESEETTETPAEEAAPAEETSDEESAPEPDTVEAAPAEEADEPKETEETTEPEESAAPEIEAAPETPSEEAEEEKKEE